MPQSPLSKKLHIKTGYRGIIIDPPNGYTNMLAPLPEGTTLMKKGGKDLDFVQLFVLDISKLTKKAPGAIAALKEDGLLWISYPKKSSGLKSDLTRDSVWEVMKPFGWRGVAMISIDDTWSAFRFRPSHLVK